MFELANNEKMLIVRRRLGQSQSQRAEILGVPFGRYRLWEMGTTMMGNGHHCPECELGEITEPERLFMTRKRRGYSQRDVAEELGVSEGWIRKLEKGLGNMTILQEFWNETKSD